MGKKKKTETAWKMGRALVSSFLFDTPRLARLKEFAHKSVCGSESTSVFSGSSYMLSQSGPYWIGDLIILPVPLLMCVFGPLCKMRGRDH